MANPSEKATGAEAGTPEKPAKSKWWRILVFGVPITTAFGLFVAGIIFWGGFNTAMEATNTLGFCISCHEMKENVYKEYTKTIHFQNRTGVRATCSDCHVPDPWVHKFVRKIKASNELVHKVLGTIDTPEKFNARRLKMAKSVWHSMKNTDSRECRNCHDFQSMKPEMQRPRARKQHLNAFKSGQTCIDCHKGIAHKGVRDLLTEEELEALEKPNPAYKRVVPADYLASLEKVEKLEAAEAEEKQKQQDAAEAAIQQRIATAVAAAMAAENTKSAGNSSQQEGSATSGGAAPEAGDSSGVDWAGVKAQTITLFYPGQASFEWVQTGKDHGGARAFVKAGDRCATCHAKEVREMGAKIVSGEKVEPTPIPGKRGHVDIKLKAVHDGKMLHMQFQWAEAGHTPAPFVDGGKMDPDNQIKLAVMFAGTDIKLVEQAGCWATCHHDSRYMPDHPDTAAITDAGDLGQTIDVTDGITKYLAESRTKVEVKGRRGKKRGGWNKLKPTEEISELAKAGAFMDLIRYTSGGVGENGHVLAQRKMDGGAQITGSGKLENGTWTVVLSRPLETDKPGDVSLQPGELYTVGFALHDDFTTARFHHVSLEFTLGLDNADAEINAVKK